MSIPTFLTPDLDNANTCVPPETSLRRFTLHAAWRVSKAALWLMIATLIVIAGCGTGGYPGGGITGISASSIVLDAGQSFGITATITGNLPVTWSLAGASCSGSACGVVSASTGTSVTYTAPSGISGQMQVTLTASIANTKSKQTVSITVNPDPTLSGTPPAGVVGTPYSTTIVAAGGTTPLTLSIASGSLPAGLTFNASTGVISGTPTTAGTSSFTVQLVDSSVTPFTVTAHETITISAPVSPLTLIGGPQPAGTVGIAYSTSLTASGGVTPYSWSIASGTLPAGLSISPTTGIISGTPTAQGTSNFVVQVKDATNATATAAASITINAANTLALTTTTLPNGTVGVPYSATIGVSGGTSPYSCAITAGTLPAGLSLGAGCKVTGTPTTAGSSTVTVKATDSSSPANTVTGPETIVISPAPLTLTTTTLPNGTVGVPYSATIGVSGGTSPYSCSITAGTLPAGLALGAGCAVTGTPTTAGSSTVTVKATDSSSPANTVTGPETIVISPAALTLTTTTLPNGTVGVPYSATIGVSGGTSPYSCSITAGTLPAGLTLGAGCAVTGTPTTAETSTVTVKATDSSSPANSVTGPETITIDPAALTLTTTTLPNGIVGVAYSATIGVSGGTSPYSCTITSGTLPAGLTLGAACKVTGTPTTAGTSTVTVKATDSSNPAKTVSGPQTIVISPAALTLTSTSLPNGTVGVPYSATIGVSGGTSPYSCTVTAGTLPAGLSMGAGCKVSGTPTTAGTSTVTVKATDSGSPAQTVSGPQTIVISPAALSLGSSNLPNGTVGVPYSATIDVTGGTAPYSCSITAGTLPAGLTLGAGCKVTGTPTTAGTSTVTVKATDSGNPAQTVSGPQTIVISPAALSLGSSNLPNGTVGVPYSATIDVTGGTAPYSCSITAGTLPAGLTLGAGCKVSGTPTTAGTSTVTVKATDSGSPAQTVSGPQTIVISPAPLTLTSTSLPNGQVGVPYSATIGVSGGTSPYSCTVTAGTLPAGLTMGAGCKVSGTPTTAGTSTVTVKATDSGNPAETVSGPETIVIAPATLTLTTTKLPNGTVGVPYTGTIGVTGGTPPYSCTITAGTLPAGLILNGCTVTGTPTTAGTSTVTVTVTDSGSPKQTATGPETIVISPAPLTLTNSTLPNGTVGVPYSATIGASGGTSPYSCTITSGTLPAGLTLGAGCVVSGTPTTAETSTVTVKVTDSGNPAQTATGPETITIDPAALILTSSTLPNGTVGVPYSATIQASGGTSPYSCAITSGTLPAGLTLAGNCTVSGTPTAAGTSTVTVKVTDSGNPAKTVTGPETITIEPAGTLSLSGTLPNAILNVPYSYTLHATGGLTPYSYSLTAGSLPPGISLNSDGTISGTPTAAGATSLTVTVTDSETPAQTATAQYILLVVYKQTPPDSELTGPYAYLFQGYDDVVAGVLAYHTASIGSFTADGMGGITAGELDANHQSSNPSGTTVATQAFLGTYVVNTDNRGFITITTLNSDGTTDRTFTYAISLKAPVAPATISTQGSLIEFDDNQLVGTKGSGTLLAQTTSAYAAGLKGSYAFGLSGDTPCLISCTVGIASGPVATVGQFTTDGAGNISTGTADANIASINFPSAPLNGTYETADQNGRLDLSMTNTSISDGLYPTDYAVYIVNANQAFIMSTDKHSAYTLLAGTAQLQTESAFSNASVNGPFIGYENAQSNPGLLGTTLENVLNFSTATVFRATGNGAGTCNTTNVDTAGLTSLIDNLTGLANGNLLLEALLGSSTATGTSTCEVNVNGRGELNYPQPPGLINTLLALLGLPTGPPPPRVFYLVAPDSGYFLETGYAGLGQFEAQTGSPFSLATLNGTFVDSTIPASSLASINSSGFFTADGAGHATYTLDDNVGVGTLNILELGVTTTTTYTLKDATAGRYVLGDGTTVIYAISPQRFVVIDTNPLTTSPTVSLLY